MPRFYQPNDIKALIGVSPETLRDWRRRKILGSIGCLALPNGGWTVDPNDPRLSEVGRPTWVYMQGDLVRIAIAQNLIEIGMDLAAALDLADLATPHVSAWLDPQGLNTWRYPRYMIAWPSSEGSNNMGVPIGGLTAVRLDDLSNIPLYIGAKALIIDFERLAGALPKPLAELYAEGAR